MPASWISCRCRPAGSTCDGGSEAIGCPTLVVRGELDALCSDEMHEEIRAAVPHARYVRVPDCGHLATLEQGPAMTALLDYWWGGVDGGQCDP